MAAKASPSGLVPLLNKPVLAVRVPGELRERVIKLLRDSVEGIILEAQWPRRQHVRQRGELTLYFAASKAALATVKVPQMKRPEDHRAPWNCSHCTFLNPNPLGLICEVCDSPRNLVEWSGFKTKQSPNVARARLALAFAVCAKAVTVLATGGVVDRAFETGGVLLLTHAALSWDALVDKFNTEMHGERDPPIKRIRVRCARKAQERIITKHMELCKGTTVGCRLDPKPESYTHVFAAMQIGAETAEDLGVRLSDVVADGSGGEEGAAAAPAPPELYLFSILPRKNDYASMAPNNRPVPPEVTRVCRAYHKIEELASASPVVAAALAEAAALPGGGCALDVGAAPGGWTAYLSERLGRVLAVDPAALDEDVAKSPAVKHIKCRLQTPEEAQAEGAPDAYAAIREACADGVLPSLVSCDINMMPVDAVQICLRALPVLAPGCVFAITMKLPGRGVRSSADMVQRAKELLSTVCHEDSVEEHWLFANTYNERTVVGRLASPSAGATGADVLQVVKTRQRGLHVIFVGVPDSIEAIKTLRLCHVAGVTSIHLVPGKGGHDEDSMLAVQRAGEHLLLRVTRHATLESCIHGLPDAALGRVVPIADEADCADFKTTSLLAADMVGPAADIPTELCLYLCAEQVAAVIEAHPGSIAVAVPARGLQRLNSSSIMAGKALSEVERQRVVSAASYSLTEEDIKNETEFLSKLPEADVGGAA